MSRLPTIRDVARDERGVGLIELLIVLAILGTIVGAVMTLFASAIKSEVVLTDRVQAQEQARMALEIMRRDIHCANSVTVSTARSITMNLPMGCPSGSPTASTTAAWCTNTDGSQFTLHKAPSASVCDAGGGMVFARHFTSGSVFTYKTGGDKLAKLCVDFQVDANPSNSHGVFRLKDELVLRNTTRTTGAETPC